MNLPETLVAGIFLALYAWTAYNTPALLSGLARLIREKDEAGRTPSKYPFFSVIVAAKNEASVVGRLLQRLTALNYPGRYEVVVVEDGSQDETQAICQHYAARHPELITFFHRDISTGKPAALNFGASKARGDVIAVVDADNVPEADFLTNAAAYFSDSSVAAVQGMTRSINRDENIITKIEAYEDEAWFKVYMRGKDALGLFVPLTGSCGFIRKDVLRELHGWDEGSIAEDVELAARLVKRGLAIRYAPEILSWQESPSTVTRLARQKTRWFRGYVETLAKYGSLLTRPNKPSLDAEVTLFGPIVLNICLASYFTSLYAMFFPSSVLGKLPILLADSASILTVFTFAVCGIALAYETKPRKLKNLAWIPALFLYWFFQTLLATRAVLLFLLRRPCTWTRTVKTGAVTVDLERQMTLNLKPPP
jgi:cellulose synthase/poly-beta-1,6-N-acetylglucosamine synthase-like glycosyltransferase